MTKEEAIQFLDNIKGEEADNMIYNIKGLSKIGTYFEFGGF